MGIRDNNVMVVRDNDMEISERGGRYMSK